MIGVFLCFLCFYLFFDLVVVVVFGLGFLVGFFWEVGMGVCLLMPIFEIELNFQNVNELVLNSFRPRFSEMLV